MGPVSLAARYTPTYGRASIWRSANTCTRTRTHARTHASTHHNAGVERRTLSTHDFALCVNVSVEAVDRSCSVAHPLHCRREHVEVRHGVCTCVCVCLCVCPGLEFLQTAHATELVWHAYRAAQAVATHLRTLAPKACRTRGVPLAASKDRGADRQAEVLTVRRLHVPGLCQLPSARRANCPTGMWCALERPRASSTTS